MKKIVWILLIGLLLLSGLFFYTRYFEFTGFRVIFFNVGQGDSALIQFDNGEKMLVDCGPDKKVLSKLGDYLPFYDRKIDYLLISHPDGDHYGGCVDVLKRYEVGMVIENGVNKEYDPFWKVWEQEIKNKKSKIKNIDGHEIWTIASTTLEFFSPDDTLGLSDKDKGGNNSSIVFKLTHGGESFLFVGDAEVVLENALLKKYCVNHQILNLKSLILNSCPTLHADYLKIGHHGSDSSSGDEFIEAVSPKFAIISVGKNTFGHPSLRVLRHLERGGVQIWRTDKVYDIILK